MKKKIVYYLYLDRSGALKARKQRYTTADGELCVKLTINVPKGFFKPPQIYKEISANIPALPSLTPDVSVSE